MTRKWWTLAGACSGIFLLMLDSTVVALALPQIRGDVGASSEGLQWVMNGYLLTIAVLVVTAGRFGDMFGRKRVFLVGMGLFAAGSVLSGAAGDEQARALGIWAAVSAVALAIGPLAGGLLIELDWRVIFWMNLPVSALGVGARRRSSPWSSSASPRSSPSGGSSTASATRSSTSSSSATVPTSAPAPPPSPWSAPTGR